MYNMCTNNITDMPVSEIFYQFYPQGLLYAYENNICLFITEPALGNCVRSLVVRALERYSKDPGSSPGGDACFSH